MGLVVVQNDYLDGARAVIGEESLPEMALRGWVVVGEASSVLETRTVAEQAADALAADEAEKNARDAAEAVLVAQSTDDDPSPAKRRPSAAK